MPWRKLMPLITALPVTTRFQNGRLAPRELTVAGGRSVSVDFRFARTDLLPLAFAGQSRSLEDMLY